MTNAGGNPAEERLRFIKHKGHSIYLIDFKNCPAKELLVLLELIRADVARHEPGSVLTLVEITGAQIDKQVATRVKEVLVLDRPYVKRSAWVGTESLPHVFYEHFKNFSQRELPVFKTREEAMEWLVSGVAPSSRTLLDIAISDSYHHTMQVSVADAKNKLPELIKAVEAGEPVTICRRGVPVVDIVRTKKPVRKKRILGALRGQIKIIDPDWWKPMTDKEVDDFLEGRY